MTRQEAQKYRPPEKYEEDGDGYRLLMPLQDHIDTIDAIYDDFESRKCKNCNELQPNFNNTCGLGVSIPDDYEGNSDLEFGCNSFIKKDINE